MIVKGWPGLTLKSLSMYETQWDTVKHELMIVESEWFSLPGYNQ